MKRIRIFNDRYPLLGPILWGLSIQYYVIQIIVAKAWAMPYSISKNTISDLANTACGPYRDGYVCSPLHSLMNASFITLGITMLLGAGLLYHEFKPSKRSALGFLGLALAGLGTAFVGLFPENVNLTLHFLSASLPFLIGNLGVLILGLSLDLPKVMKAYTILTGAVALVALPCFVFGAYLGLGYGGMERVVAYPQTTWLIFFGLYTGMNHYRKLRNS